MLHCLVIQFFAHSIMLWFGHCGPSSGSESRIFALTLIIGFVMKSLHNENEIISMNIGKK